MSTATLTASRFAGSVCCASALSSASFWAGGSAVELVLHRSQQLGEPGVGERGFALDAVHRELGEAGGAVAPVSEQGRLADPGLAPEDEHSARSGPGIGEHAIDAVALRPATYEHGVERTRHLGSRHPKTW